MRNFSEYFIRMATSGTEIQSEIMKGMGKVLARTVKYSTIDDGVDKMLLRK